MFTERATNKREVRKGERNVVRKDPTNLLYLRPVLVLLVVLALRHLDDLGWLI
jgi:hypothetical protein